MVANIQGACHCGNISYELGTATPLEAITARSCDCTFCRLHGARTWSDPDGEAIIHVADPERLRRYRFGTGSTDFLICASCGAYAGAMVSEGARTWVTLNLRLTGVKVPANPVHYGAEDRDSRTSRRQQLWTPARLIEGP